MKKIGIVIGLLVFLSVVAFIGYKMYYINYYNFFSNVNESNYHTYINSLKEDNRVNIKKDNSVGDYIEYKNMKIRNDFQDFNLINTSNYQYALKDADGNTKAVFWLIADESSYIDTMLSLVSDDKKLSTEDQIRKYLRENDINSDEDLLYFIANNYNKKFDIFSKIAEMRNYYTINYYVSQLFSPYDKVYFIDGDFTGYVLDITGTLKGKEVHLYKDNKQYGAVFLGQDYFTDNYINELLSTITIN